MSITREEALEIVDYIVYYQTNVDKICDLRDAQRRLKDFINQQTTPNELTPQLREEIIEINVEGLPYIISKNDVAHKLLMLSKIELLLGRSELEPYEILCLINKYFKESE